LGWLHAFQVFGVGESWQEKKIREIMNNQKNNNNGNI
jgi:hypothetical protein